MDWATAGILAGVVTLEGFRRLPPGALVLRRAGWGTWSMAGGEGERGRWTLVSWWPPLFASVVLLAPSAPAAATDLPGLLRRARPWRSALGLLGFLTLVALLGGLPLAATHLGGWGFVASLGGVFTLAGAATGVSALARGRLNLPRRPALAALSPFATPQAGERLLEQILARVPRLVAVRTLVPATRFHAWIRPAVYDASAAGVMDPELAAVLTPGLRDEVLAPPSRTPGADRYCPRCGASYRQGDVCGDCRGVALVGLAP